MLVTHRASPRLVVAGVASGVGKTTFTVGLCRALQRRGLAVAAFKCGPDYLDPTYHRVATGRPVHNLDGWLMGEDAVRSTFARNATDVSVIEGMMGLFDGLSATSIAGSSAEIARALHAPVALVCDASGMARSVAALAQGFATYDSGVKVAALICNRIGGRAHLDLLREACPTPPILGGLPSRPEHAFPERHLGLHAAHELDLDQTIEAWADQVEASCDVEALLALACAAAPLEAALRRSSSARTQRCRIGVARDAAFHFYYDANLRMLEDAGAELVPFSPLDGDALPDVDGVLIGGGYPELHAAQLAANRAVLDGLRALAAAGGPIYAECGGFMYLADAIVDLAGDKHAMVGLVSGTVVMCDRLQALGYVEVETLEETMLGPTGTSFRGHQFRYSRLDSAPVVGRYAVRRSRTGATEREGWGSGNVLASYVHAHWASNTQVPRAFVDSCARSREG